MLGQKHSSDTEEQQPPVPENQSRDPDMAAVICIKTVSSQPHTLYPRHPVIKRWYSQRLIS